MNDESATRQVADRIRGLRAQRRWSARELAEECARAGAPSLTRGTIAKIESGARGFVTVDELAVLARVLDVSPADLVAEPASLVARHAPVLGNLPAEPDNFIGRERDLADLATMLQRVRILTLAGPGGIGKTRLALRLAEALRRDFPDGAWIADFGDQTDPGLVTHVVAAMLGIRQEPDRPLAETVTDALRERDLLVIFDTCEHVAGACADLVQRLRATCPGVRVIVTSRVPLGIRGEVVWRVPPLRLPEDSGEARLGDLVRSEAVQLFAARAAAARPGYSLDANEARTAAEICRALDGVPLAIELAAAGMRSLSAEQLRKRLASAFEPLAAGDRASPARQRTLSAAVAWSFDQLTEQERALLRRLSVFSGWSLDMAEQVCADTLVPKNRVFELLTALIDKSLVTLDGELAGEARYRLLGTVRKFAAGQRAARGEEQELRLAHRDYMLALAEGYAGQIIAWDQPPWPDRILMYRRLRGEMANFSEALEWCLTSGDAEHGLRICLALSRMWLAVGDRTATGWLDRFLALPAPIPATIKARAYRLHAELAFERGDYELAERSATTARDHSAMPDPGTLAILALLALAQGYPVQALSLAETAVEASHLESDRFQTGIALSARAVVLASQDRLQEAREDYEAALSSYGADNGWGVANVRFGLGILAKARGDRLAAARHLQDALSIYRDIDARPEIARCLVELSRLALDDGDIPQAATALAEATKISQAMGNRLAIVRCLFTAARLLAARGDPINAVRLASAGSQAWSAVSPSAARTSRSMETILTTARKDLGDSAVADLTTEGAVLGTSQATALVLELFRPPSAGSRASVSVAEPTGLPHRQEAAFRLSPREMEIVNLVAAGMSNREIAGELYISLSTAARHLANIYVKLGVNSRVQVKAWMTEKRPLHDQVGG